MKRWLIRMRRPMRPKHKKDDRAFGRCVIGWVPISDNIVYRVKHRYWDSKYKMWSSGDGTAYQYTSRERAEKTAFKLVANDPSLIGEVEIEEIGVAEHIHGPLCKKLKLND